MLSSAVTATRGWVTRATTMTVVVVARARASSSSSSSSSTLARANGDDDGAETTPEDERPWRRRATHRASAPARASWSTTSMMTAPTRIDDDEEESSVLAPGELASVARLVGLNLEAMEARERFARDVEEVVRLAGRLDAATAARDGEDARPMWTTRETNEDGGGEDGLRMRFDAAARARGEAGERETASAERGRLLGEAAYGTESFRYVAPRSAIEE